MYENEKLDIRERRVQDECMRKLAIVPRKTKQPVVIAIVGLVGSGKTSVARELAKFIPAAIIEGDQIRVCLRETKAPYTHVQKIAEDACVQALKKGGNVILDGDYVERKKQTSLREKIKTLKAKLIFIRTFADYDVMVGRIVSAKYHNQPEDFFGGAGTKWDGSEQSRGAVVKLRELWRRSPHHYQWSADGGGSWKLKKPSFSLYADIDTTESDAWEKEVEQVARKILTL